MVLQARDRDVCLDEAGYTDPGEDRAGLLVVFMEVVESFAAPGAEKALYAALATPLWREEAKPDLVCAAFCVCLIFAEEAVSDSRAYDTPCLQYLDALAEHGTVGELQPMLLDVPYLGISEPRAQ